MRLAAVLILTGMLMVAGLGAADAGAGDPASLLSRLDRDPYDYRARQQLIQAYRQTADHGSAFYHAAWLRWLAPRQYAMSAEGFGWLRDRRARDRAAARGQGVPLTMVIAAVDAERRLAECCFNGAIAQQAARLRGEINDLIVRVEQGEMARGKGDPVGRMAIAHLYLALDDVLCFENTPESQRARGPVLRKAATQCAALCSSLPESPGAHRTLAIVRARMAELDNRAELWGLAIAECTKAHRLDPGDGSLPEMLWTLNLRAGHWREAKRWEALCTGESLSRPNGAP